MASLTTRLHCLASVFALAVISPVAAQDLDRILANDNRTPAGDLRKGVLSLQFDLKEGVWYPESEKGEAIPAYSFGEVGKPLQAPGPTIRVAQGTIIDISLRNSLTVPVRLYGFHQRPGESEAVIVDPKETRRIRFDAGEPGTYLYWGRTPDGKRGNGRVLDALLGGALVIDRPGADPTQDRIFVLERWNAARRTAINGKSWPFTERLEAQVGKAVNWKVINASDLSHPMHLHGFYFSLDAQGDGDSYTVFEEDKRPMEFTHSVEVMETFEITWVPKEPGRWLYHCHRMPHMRLPLPLDPDDAFIPDNNPDHERMHEWDSGFAGMGGMILGVTVTGRSEFDTVNGWTPERRLEIDVGNQGSSPDLYHLALDDLDSDKPPATSTGLAGPLLLVTEGQHTEITVKNTSRKPTSIHWHGLEIESYYDGVPWWSGIGEKRAPLIEPGHEFLVKMIPQQAGSYIYHTHWHDEGQLTGGVHGPMIVLPPGQSYDPSSDKSFLFSVSPLEPYGSRLLLMNGAPQHPRMRLPAGRTCRFRFMNITPAVDSLHVSLRDSDGPVLWAPRAKDGEAIVGGAPQRAVQHIAIGETFDFEYVAEGNEELTLEGWASPGNGQRVVQTLIFE